MKHDKIVIIIGIILILGLLNLLMLKWLFSSQYNIHDENVSIEKAINERLVFENYEIGCSNSECIIRLLLK